MKMMPKAMPSDQISPMAESSRIRFPEDGRLDAQRRGDGEKQRAGDRIGAEVVGHADTSERSVRDASAQEHQPAAYDVCADKAAGDTAQQTGERCVGEELVLENF